jgi:hypothetical protein
LYQRVTISLTSKGNIKTWIFDYRDEEMNSILFIINNTIIYVRDDHSFSSFLFIRSYNKMRKSATTILPRSTSTHLASLQRKNSSSSTTTTTQFPHSKSHHDCQQMITNNFNTNIRSRSICSRSNLSISATTNELSRFEPILNHDTDSLKIGDRIYVNGQWSGIILYIGETTLGKGDWAGVILDDSSLGKTNGIVRGRCYFQTTNNGGIFSRLTKLTREKMSSYEINKQ